MTKSKITGYLQVVPGEDPIYWCEYDLVTYFLEDEILYDLSTLTDDNLIKQKNKKYFGTNDYNIKNIERFKMKKALDKAYRQSFNEDVIETLNDLGYDIVKVERKNDV